MNERIWKLAEQIVCFEQDMDGSMEPNEDGQWIRVDELEKFALLIVRECAVYCEGHILPKGVAEENGLNYNDGVMDCAIGLLQHFGV